MCCISELPEFGIPAVAGLAAEDAWANRYGQESMDKRTPTGTRREDIR
jgi:hypothetical protein